MILVRLEIENYKQFAGQHRIEPSPNGIVGVLGPNGVGKTTLFEAIEWCLYNPREISTEEIRPRGGTGHTRVKVTLEDPRDGTHYVVERVRKGKQITADVYREDQPENRIVTGTRQVTEYVARQLVGLSHRAFVSTFFTRQKELSFFGGLKETDRRREVGRLLGLETIRDAQRRIAEARSEARTDAAGLQSLHHDAIEGRDFAAERFSAEAELAARQVDLESATARVSVAGSALIQAQQELNRWHDLERRDNELALAIERSSGEERAQAAARTTANEELSRLDEAKQNRAALAPIAEQEPIRSQLVSAFDTDRTRYEQRRRLQADLARTEQNVVRSTNRLRETVDGTPTGRDIPEAWVWRPADDADPIAAAERLRIAAMGLDLAGALAVATGLATCLRLVEERDRQAKKAQSFRARLRDLEEEEAVIVSSGDPHTAAAEARQERELALAEAMSAATAKHGEITSRTRLAKAAESLRQFDFSTPCPTCQRPFTVDEAETVLATLQSAIAEHQATEASLSWSEREAQAVAEAAALRAASAEEQAKKLDNARARLDQGRPLVEEAERDWQQAVEACRAELERHHLKCDPTEVEVVAAHSRAERIQAVAATVPTLEQTRTDLVAWLQEADDARAALGQLGEVTYAAAAHEQAQVALDEARQAAARIVELDRNLARRPEVEAALTATDVRLRELAKERVDLDASRVALGFTPALLEQAQATQQAAANEEREAIQRQNLAQSLVGDSGRVLRDLDQEIARIERLEARAGQRQRDADDLDRMYREFSRFDQWVAEQVTPQLAEHTGELLAAVTEGKYDRVQFDENYGLEIFDEDEAFPIESFSGGERDVAALCARLALSRLVGGQSGHPPEFLVLDEVFGSLDRDRRTQVLEMLGTLAASTEAFRQLFIISHVDDVRASAVFNQVWRIAETDGGSSRFEDITTGSGVEEM